MGRTPRIRLSFPMNGSPAATARGIKASSPFFFMNLIEKVACLLSGVSFISYSFSARLRLMVFISAIILFLGKDIWQRWGEKGQKKIRIYKMKGFAEFWELKKAWRLAGLI